VALVGVGNQRAHLAARRTVKCKHQSARPVVV
jgi:hypothetical protein